MRGSSFPLWALGALAACGQSSPSAPAGVDAGDDVSPGNDAAATQDAPASADGGPTSRVRVMAANLTSGSNQSYEAAGHRHLPGAAPGRRAHPGVQLRLGQPAHARRHRVRDGLLLLRGAAHGRHPRRRREPLPHPAVRRRGPTPAPPIAPSPTRASTCRARSTSGPSACTCSRRAPPSARPRRRSCSGTSRPRCRRATTSSSAATSTPTPPSEQALTILSAAVVTAPPYPADQSGNTNSSINRNHPHDWVLASPGLAALEEPVVIGAGTFATGLVFDSRVYTPLSDVPARARHGLGAPPGCSTCPSCATSGYHRRHEGRPGEHRSHRVRDPGEGGRRHRVVDQVRSGAVRARGREAPARAREAARGTRGGGDARGRDPRRRGNPARGHAPHAHHPARRVPRQGQARGGRDVRGAHRRREPRSICASSPSTRRR